MSSFRGFPKNNCISSLKIFWNLKYSSIECFQQANNKNNHNSNNHVKASRKEAKQNDNNDRKEKRPKLDKEKTDKSNEKAPHSSGTKRKLEDGECDPEPNENKRHER